MAIHQYMIKRICSRGLLASSRSGSRGTTIASLLRPAGTERARLAGGRDLLRHAGGLAGAAWTRSRPLGAPFRMAHAGVIQSKVHSLFFPQQYPEVSLDESDAFSAPADLLALIVPEAAFATEEGEAAGPLRLGDALSKLDGERFGGLLAALVAANDFRATEGAVAVGPWVGGSAKSVALLALGAAAADGSLRGALKAAGKQVAATACAAKFASARVALLGAPGAPELQAGDLEGLAAGLVAAGSKPISLKREDGGEGRPPPALARVAVHAPTAGAARALNAGAAFAQGTLLARYLVDAPPNVCTPSHLAAAAAEIQRAFPDVYQLEVLEAGQCREMGMGLFLGVAECSEEPPKFIHLTYRSPGAGERKVIGLVGKGLTFDSGGYNLKVGASMIELMKFDMGGAGAVFGAAMAIGQLQPPGLEIHIISASCENMVSGKGMRPGDVLTAANGKTVEVNNTDAEGRLTLADALWFAQERCGVAKVVDIATLTGACMIALGGEVAGLFSPAAGLAGALAAAGDGSGEKVWAMPMHEAYFAQMKSQIADMKNTGGRMGGAITAALFLKQYVNSEVEWAHIDIAGPAWDEKAGRATGFGAELLARWAVGEAPPQQQG